MYCAPKVRVNQVLTKASPSNQGLKIIQDFMIKLKLL